MQSIELIPSAPGAEISPELENVQRDPTQPQRPDELFDAVMGRALTRSPQGASDDSDSANEPPGDQNRSPRTRRAESTDAVPAVGTDPAAQASTVAATPSENSNPRAGTSPAVAAASGPGKTAESLPDPSGSAASAALGTAANGPAADPASTGHQPVTSGAGATGGDTSVRQLDLMKELAATSEPAAGAESNPAEMPASGQEARRLDSAASPAGNGRLSVPEPISLRNPETAGISSAQQPLPMQKAEKTNEFTAPAEQNLPVPAAGVTGDELPGNVVRLINSLPRQEKPEPTSTLSATGSGTATPAEPVSSTNQSAPWPSATPMRSLERTQDLMSLHAFRLRDSGADSLQVTIKPGPGLQLSLSLQMRDGQVEMRATLHRGDFDFMNRHWSELQQQLEPRGVRLAPLTCDEQARAGNNNLFQQPDRQKPEEDTVSPGAFPKFALGSASKPSTSTGAQTLRGWESWA